MGLHRPQHRRLSVDAVIHDVEVIALSHFSPSASEKIQVMAIPWETYAYL
jgi:hypothetical protein